MLHTNLSSILSKFEWFHKLIWFVYCNVWSPVNDIITYCKGCVPWGCIFCEDECIVYCTSLNKIMYPPRNACPFWRPFQHILSDHISPICRHILPFPLVPSRQMRKLPYFAIMSAPLCNKVVPLWNTYAIF